MDFRPLEARERNDLIEALRGNAMGNRVLLLDARDTSFAGVADEIPADDTIHAVKSIPVHY